jgi:hypothetical protein
MLTVTVSISGCLYGRKISYCMGMGRTKFSIFLHAVLRDNFIFALPFINGILCCVR